MKNEIVGSKANQEPFKVEITFADGSIADTTFANAPQTEAYLHTMLSDENLAIVAINIAIFR